MQTDATYEASSTSPTEAWTAVRCTWSDLLQNGHETLIVWWVDLLRFTRETRWLASYFRWFGGVIHPLKKITTFWSQSFPQLKDPQQFFGGTPWSKNQFLDEAYAWTSACEMSPDCCRNGWPKVGVWIRPWSQRSKNVNLQLNIVRMWFATSLWLVPLMSIFFAMPRKKWNGKKQTFLQSI